MNKSDIHAFMTRFRYGVESSIAPDGWPQSARVGIAVTTELEVFFDTVRSSRKYQNLIACPSCSFVVGWGGEQTVQVEGTAVEPQGMELERIRESYFSVWPDGLDRIGWPDLTYFVVKPRWLRFSDFDRSPALIVEMNLPM